MKQSAEFSSYASLSEEGNGSAEASPRWDLGAIYAGTKDPSIDSDLCRANDLALAFAKTYRGKIAQLDALSLALALASLEELVDVAYRPPTYAQLHFATATNDAEAQALKARIVEQETAIMNHVRFVDVELKDVPEKTYSAWLASAELAHYRHYLRRARRQAPHTLSEKEEQLAATKNLTGRQAWAQLYTELTSSWRFTFEAAGETRERTLAEVRALRSHGDRDVRKRAQQTVQQRFSESSQVLTYITNTLYQDHKLETDLRNFSSPMAPTVLDDELSPEVVEALMSSVEEAYPLAQEYYVLKARVLGLSDFSSFDVLAPYEASPRRIPFADARRLVVDAFGKLTPRFAEEADRFFIERRIDAEPRPGKRDGAFCSGTLPSLSPYVLTNYTGRIEDVATIAHELGHGVHFVLAGEQQTPLNYWPTTPLAETASVFGELVLARDLLSQESDPRARRALLAGRIEDALATIMRQVLYTRWEQKAHALRAEGVVPAEEYCTLWAAELGRMYGSAVALTPLDRWGWITIPHLVHYRFYCYSYAFGMLLVYALYKRWEKDGAAFVPGYLELLAAGGSLEPTTMLEKVGVDITNPDFWRGGLEVLREQLAAFRAEVP